MPLCLHTPRKVVGESHHTGDIDLHHSHLQRQIAFHEKTCIAKARGWHEQTHFVPGCGSQHLLHRVWLLKVCHQHFCFDAIGPYQLCCFLQLRGIARYQNEMQPLLCQPQCYLPAYAGRRASHQCPRAILLLKFLFLHSRAF